MIALWMAVRLPTTANHSIMISSQEMERSPMTISGYPEIVIGDLSISWLEIMMLWFAVVGNLTAIQRAIITWRNLGKMYDGDGEKKE